MHCNKLNYYTVQWRWHQTSLMKYNVMQHHNSVGVKLKCTTCIFFYNIFTRAVQDLTRSHTGYIVKLHLILQLFCQWFIGRLAPECQEFIFSQWLFSWLLRQSIFELVLCILNNYSLIKCVNKLIINTILQNYHSKMPKVLITRMGDLMHCK